MELVSAFWARSNERALASSMKREDERRLRAVSFIDDATGQLPNCGGGGVSAVLDIGGPELLFPK